MVLKRKFDIFFLIIFLIFSIWLMNKSFGYDGINHQFRIARHQIGDFGLHLSLIRSFSWGDNFPIESPFYPGQSLPYHYYFDLLIGFLNRIGLPISIAFNGVSALAFTILLYLIYKLPQAVFFKSKLLGVISVVLFLFHSSLTFIDFIKEKGLSLSIFKNLWQLPDYIHKGPFDGSIISIFFTLNVYLNQRHLIAALAISLSIVYLLLLKLTKEQKISTKMLILLGLVLGILSRIHILTFFGTTLTIFLFLILFKRWRLILPLFLPAGLFFLFYFKEVLSQDIGHVLFNPGFLSEKPLSFFSFIKFWFLNLGVALLLIPIGFFICKRRQKLIFLSVFSLFVIGNIFQLSYRIDHNHSLFNFFIIFANFYIAYILVMILKKNTLLRKFIFSVLLFLLTLSGLIDLMAIKNDFQFYLPDAPANVFMQWVKKDTKRNDVFLAKQEILDPITLSGRKNYLGHDYYLSVMGYNYTDRLNRTKLYYEANSTQAFENMRKENISYIVIPIKPVQDFQYKINTGFFNKYLKKAYQDNDVVVYKL